jgi:hypothetical protein
MRCDGEPVRPGMRTTRATSRVSQPDKQNGTLPRIPSGPAVRQPSRLTGPIRKFALRNGSKSFTAPIGIEKAVLLYTNPLRAFLTSGTRWARTIPSEMDTARSIWTASNGRSWRTPTMRPPADRVRCAGTPDVLASAGQDGPFCMRSVITSRRTLTRSRALTKRKN